MPAMKQNLNLKDHRHETNLFTRRVMVCVGLTLLLACILIIRLAYLQIKQHVFYSTLSQQNMVNIIPIEPNRGLIYDRNGVLLAKNVPIFNLTITRGRVKNLRKTIAQLRKTITISDDDIKLFYHIMRQYRRYQPVPLKLKLSDEELAKFYVNQFRFPGVSIQSQMMRYYPLGEPLASVVGYVGRINSKELYQYNNVNYRASNYIGKTGIEKYYESLLHGNVGVTEAETDASGRIVRNLKITPPVPGKNLILTIDAKLQAFAYQTLESNNGAIVAIDPNNGGILALVTKPSYDPNFLVNGITAENYHRLTTAENHPLYNRAIRGEYSPGSTVKPFFAIAGLNDDVISKDYKVYDRGEFQVENTTHVYHDWKPYGHGWVNLVKAITVSCDVFFYNLAVNLGIARIDQTLQTFGFGQTTGIDLPEESKGLVPSPEWKMNTRGKSWFTGDSVNAVIGQGYVLATPLQLANATAMLAMHGQRYVPHVLQKAQSSEETLEKTPELAAEYALTDSDYWQIVISAMQKVITSPYGTAEYFGRNPPYTVAAKTGTAQVFGTYRNEERNRTDIPEHLRNNHLFIAFAPVDKPKIALAIVVEHQAFADKIARQVLDFYMHEDKHS